MMPPFDFIIIFFQKRKLNIIMMNDEVLLIIKYTFFA